MISSMNGSVSLCLLGLLSSFCFINCNSRSLSSPRFLMIFLSYLAFTLSASIVFPLGPVAQLHEWHWALIFALWRQILWYILEYLWPPASSDQLFFWLQDMQKPSPFSLVSRSLEFSCAMSKANWSFWFLLGFFVLYSLCGLPANCLSSLFILRSYSSSFFLR